MNKEKKVDLSSQKLPNGTLLAYALQHVLIMVAGAVVVPMLVAQAANDGLASAVIDQTFLISCALFVSGISTILQGLGLGNFLGAKIAVVEGTSFAALSAMQAIVRGKGEVGIQTLAGAVIIAGLMCFLLAGVWGKLLRFFPHVVTGTVVTIIGLSLYPTAIKWIAGSAAQGMGNAYEGVALVNLAVAGISLLIVLLTNKFFKGLLANLGVLFGIAGGTIAAAIFDAARGVAGTPEALIQTAAVSNANIIGAPIPFKYGLPKFDLSSIFIICIIMLVIMTEATGNMIAVHNMSNKELDSKNLSRGLRSSGLVTMLSGAFNSYPVTPFGQNVGMLALTGVFSRFVTVAAGVILLLLGFFPKFGALFAAIPQPVLGGVGFVMFGVVAVNGIRTLGQVEFNGNKNSIIVATSLGLSLIPSIIPKFFENPALPEFVRSLLHSGMAIGCISAIFLNLLFNVWFVPKSQKEAAQKAED